MSINLKLSDNFWLKEFFVSGKYPEKAAQLFNKYDVWQLDMAYQLANDNLQPIRDHIKDMTADPRIKITSGYRDKELNGFVSYTEHSLHMRMLAIDFKMVNPHNNHLLLDAFRFIIKEQKIGELILYQTESGRFTNIHFSKPTVGYKEIIKRKVRKLDGTLEDYYGS